MVNMDHTYPMWVNEISALGMVAEWSKVLIPVPWLLIPWAHNCSGSYPGYFMSSFHSYISFHLTLWVACVPLESLISYNMYLFNLRIANHKLIKILIKIKIPTPMMVNMNFTYPMLG